MADSTRLNDDEDNIQTSMDIQAEAQKRKKYVYGGIALLLTIILIIVIIVATTSGGSSSGSGSALTNVVVATWDKKDAADAAYEAMLTSTTNFKSLDGAVAGVQWCQDNCNRNAQGIKDANVDTEGKVTQSAMVIYGPRMDTGAVANLYDIDDAVLVAKYVLIYTQHALMVGEAATRFAIQNGLQRKDLYNGTDAETSYETWKAGNCSSNRYWRNVRNGNGCDLIDQPYQQDTESSVRDITGCDANETSDIGPTENNLSGGMVKGSISVIAIDDQGEMSLATSSNGLDYKIAGRVSDAAIPGAGGYIDPGVGGCTATGDGDIIIRFAPARSAVNYMKNGYSPQEAADKAIADIVMWCPNRQSIVLCLSKDGEPGIANFNEGKPNFAYRSDKCGAAVSANIDNPRGTCV